MSDTTDEPSLILWDVDRTLVDTGQVSREIYAQAFVGVTKRPLQQLADMAGRTDKAILAETLALHGLADSEAQFDEFYAALAAAARDLCGKIRSEGFRLSGAQEAMTALAENNVVQTVVTGNIKPIAMIKLEVFDLAEHIDFEIGGYGSDDIIRAALVRLAWQRAENKYRRHFKADQIVVIGDTPHDVQAARTVGVRAVGVASGGSTVEELTVAHADAVVADLTDTEAFVAAVLRQALRE